MGVAVEPGAVTTTPAETEPESTEPTADPAKALSGSKATASPGGQPRDPVAEYWDAMKGTTAHDRARANAILVELNQIGAKDKIKQITDSLAAQPITPSGF